MREVPGRLATVSPLLISWGRLGTTWLGRAFLEALLYLASLSPQAAWLLGAQTKLWAGNTNAELSRLDQGKARASRLRGGREGR